MELNQCVSLSWFINDLFPFTFETVKSSAKRWSSSSVDWLILTDRSVEPKICSKEEETKKRVKVKIKSTYRISNCQHRLNVAVTAATAAWWSPTEDHAWGSSVICFLKWSVRLGALSFSYGFLTSFSDRGIHHNFLLIDTYNKRWQRPFQGTFHRSIDRFIVRLFVYSLVDSFGNVCLSCHSFKHLIVRRQNANR